MRRGQCSSNCVGSQRFTALRSAPRAFERLSLDALNVAEFSQLVSDAFAGETWFSVLKVLEGRAPNANHHLLARWAREAHCGRSSPQTRHLDRAGTSGAGGAVPGLRRSYGPRAQRRLPDRVPVVKLHGTASRRASLVDLAAQKRRGLPTDWLDWLEVTFAGNHVDAARFSGADLALGEDYPRLKHERVHTTPAKRPREPQPPGSMIYSAGVQDRD